MKFIFKILGVTEPRRWLSNSCLLLINVTVSSYDNFLYTESHIALSLGLKLASLVTQRD